MIRMVHMIQWTASRGSGLARRGFGTGLLMVLIAMAATPARATQDIVEFGSNITVGPNETTHDAVCFFCSVNVKGTVTGDIVVFFGNVHIEGQTHHDVVNFFGHVDVADNSSIGHDMVNFFGRVRLGQNASIGKDAVVMFGRLDAADTASFGGSRVVEPGWIFWGPVIALILGIYYIVHELRAMRRRRLYGY